MQYFFSSLSRSLSLSRSARLKVSRWPSQMEPPSIQCVKKRMVGAEESVHMDSTYRLIWEKQ